MTSRCVWSWPLVLLLLWQLLSWIPQGLVAAKSSEPSTTSPSNKGIVAAYLPEYRFYINVNNTAPFLTDIMLFSLQPNSRGMLGGCCLEQNHFEVARQARAYKMEYDQQQQLKKKPTNRNDDIVDTNNNPLRLWVTLGGAGRCASFFPIIADPTKRTRLVTSLKRYW